MIIFWSTCWSFHFLNLKYTAPQFRQEKQNSTHKSGLPCLSLKCKQSTHPQTNTHHYPNPKQQPFWVHWVLLLPTGVTSFYYFTKSKTMLSFNSQITVFSRLKENTFPREKHPKNSLLLQELCFKVIFHLCGCWGWAEARWPSLLLFSRWLGLNYEIKGCAECSYLIPVVY